jgi:phospholipid/cholesterol/gamma-HCH transport system ATP-binding protein
MATLAQQDPVPATDGRSHRFVPDLSAPALTFEDVSIGFDGKPILQDISFQVRRGETRVLLGPAGAGKSVLVKLADGLLKPDSGRIFVYGHEISAMKENDIFDLRACIGMVFQESALFDSMDVRDNVSFRLLEERAPEEEIDRRVRESLRFVELEQAIDKFPSELSGGMRRRVSIARAIINHPSLILYDSPTGGLDPITSTNIVELIVKQRDVSKTSSILITHRLQDAFMLATHYFNREANRVEPYAPCQADPDTSFMILHEGRLVFNGSTHDLVHSEDPFIRELLS